MLSESASKSKLYCLSESAFSRSSMLLTVNELVLRRSLCNILRSLLMRSLLLCAFSPSRFRTLRCAYGYRASLLGSDRFVSSGNNISLLVKLGEEAEGGLSSSWEKLIFDLLLSCPLRFSSARFSFVLAPIDSDSFPVTRSDLFSTISETVVYSLITGGYCGALSF